MWIPFAIQKLYVSFHIFIHIYNCIRSSRFFSCKYNHMIPQLLLTESETQNSLTYHLLGRLLERHVNPHFSNLINTRDFQEVIDYISTHFCDKISTNYISKMFGYNETYLCRRFKDITGLSPVEYIKILRLEKARSLLKHSNESISAIAIECGFSDINYFSRRFKAHYKITPKEYHTQYLKLNWK